MKTITTNVTTNESPIKPQFQPLSMPSKKVWANILSGAAVMERPDWILEKKTRLSVFSEPEKE